MDFADLVNAGAYHCGVTPAGIYDDWRVPNFKEVASLIHYGYNNPALCNTLGTGPHTSGQPFLNVETTTFYWTSTTNMNNTSQAGFAILHDGGMATHGDKTTDYYAWLVRGGQ